MIEGPCSCWRGVCCNDTCMWTVWVLSTHRNFFAHGHMQTTCYTDRSGEGASSAPECRDKEAQRTKRQFTTSDSKVHTCTPGPAYVQSQLLHLQPVAIPSFNCAHSVRNARIKQHKWKRKGKKNKKRGHGCRMHTCSPGPADRFNLTCVTCCPASARTGGRRTWTPVGFQVTRSGFTFFFHGFCHQPLHSACRRSRSLPGQATQKRTSKKTNKLS